ncbi:MAG: indole-3-glycerol phosphate synthase TrpC [Bryobacteraceae bacterium]|nr:indole-3-glycerol phosphate synthase TrpC [Bryobacteraceae bacterium]
MLATVPDILARIVASKRTEVAGLAARRAELERRAADRMRERRDFAAALAGARPAMIAEVKQASPSAGVLTGHFDPAAIAARYEAGGAAALSVLTDGTFFRGKLSDLESARACVQSPVLRKDFTIDPVCVLEAAAHGADAILLIAAILTEREMRDLRELAAGFGMASLVEVHAESELDAALGSGAVIVGVNNRNLHTFEVRLDTSLRLAGRIPAEVLRVSESGIRSRGDIRQLQDAGFQAFLVGEHLMRSADPAAALRELIT